MVSTVSAVAYCCAPIRYKPTMLFEHAFAVF
ncbi:putative metal-binding transcription factor (methanogenesis marker protein 9) [Rhodanobacter sp. MP7CTX1]|nr:putative metal-binding transcription factor (methanogenesis marker protein 9) [Rhodanobacter sp. MP7CTX1]